MEVFDELIRNVPNKAKEDKTKTNRKKPGGTREDKRENTIGQPSVRVIFSTDWKLGAPRLVVRSYLSSSSRTVNMFSCFESREQCETNIAKPPILLQSLIDQTITVMIKTTITLFLPSFLSDFSSLLPFHSLSSPQLVCFVCLFTCHVAHLVCSSW